jgi:hypothetical protein
LTQCENIGMSCQPSSKEVFHNNGMNRLNDISDDGTSIAIWFSRIVWHPIMGQSCS